MGKNNKENFVFTLLVCTMMVLGMSLFNIGLKADLRNVPPLEFIVCFLTIFFIALPIEWFVVGRIAKKISFFLTKDTDPMMKKILFISFFIVLGMSSSMTLISLVIFDSVSWQLPSEFLGLWGKNFVVALTLQIIVVGPVARSLFIRMFPVSKAVPHS